MKRKIPLLVCFLLLACKPQVTRPGDFQISGEINGVHKSEETSRFFRMACDESKCKSLRIQEETLPSNVNQIVWVEFENGDLASFDFMDDGRVFFSWMKKESNDKSESAKEFFSSPWLLENVKFDLVKKFICNERRTSCSEKDFRYAEPVKAEQILVDLKSIS